MLKKDKVDYGLLLIAPTAEETVSFRNNDDQAGRADFCLRSIPQLGACLQVIIRRPPDEHYQQAVKVLRSTTFIFCIVIQMIILIIVTT